jgi:hypothetical protein
VLPVAARVENVTKENAMPLWPNSRYRAFLSISASLLVMTAVSSAEAARLTNVRATLHLVDGSPRV